MSEDDDKGQPAEPAKADGSLGEEELDGVAGGGTTLPVELVSAKVNVGPNAGPIDVCRTPAGDPFAVPYPNTAAAPAPSADKLLEAPFNPRLK